MDESVDTKKREQVSQIGHFATKQNNLNEMSNKAPLKCYTTPDDAEIYRTQYSSNNFSFTPQYRKDQINDSYYNDYFTTNVRSKSISQENGYFNGDKSSKFPSLSGNSATPQNLMSKEKEE